MDSAEFCSEFVFLERYVSVLQRSDFVQGTANNLQCEFGL
jgi:hypothetical protein